jgi:hypothetical protein
MLVYTSRLIHVVEVHRRRVVLFFKEREIMIEVKEEKVLYDIEKGWLKDVELQQ